MDMNKTVIFDLDGTLAKIDARRKLAAKPNGKINWQVFFDPENIPLDTPNWPVIRTFQAMKLAGFRVGIFSGRDAISWDATTNWLKEHGVDWDFFKMRPQGSFTPDDILKREWLDEMLAEGHDVMCVFDDRDKVVNMWRESGITCMQVAPGNF